MKKLLADVSLEDRYDTVSEWYDGYIFGREKMYCPWDVLRYVSSVLDGSYSVEMGPESYWVNTSETSLELIHGFLGKATSGTTKTATNIATNTTQKVETANTTGETDSAGTSGFSITESFEQLLAGKTIDCKINETLTYHNIHSNGDNIWSALLETGYLTKAVKGRMPLMPLRIPNKSITDVFRQEVWDFFSDKVDNIFVRNLSNALWTGEIETSEKTLNLTLESTLSFYHAYQEYSYHLILDGFFTGLGYRVESERESGYGRSDLMIKDPARSRALILELKHTENENEMNKWLQEATGQI
ncbi:MAG: PD-(D/E)XK nuclease domain-containing protein, partial [Synergistaceae bacterium]|nr:PD-(D/E)XK nuclease domain-containing protein [Synergistaceae bacterium]